MLELEIMCGYSQAALLQSVKVYPPSPPSPVKKPSHDDGESGASTFTLRSRAACEYPHMISSSSMYF